MPMAIRQMCSHTDSHTSSDCSKTIKLNPLALTQYSPILHRSKAQRCINVKGAANKQAEHTSLSYMHGESTAERAVCDPMRSKSLSELATPSICRLFVDTKSLEHIQNTFFQIKSVKVESRRASSFQ